MYFFFFFFFCLWWTTLVYSKSDTTYINVKVLTDDGDKDDERKCIR